MHREEGAGWWVRWVGSELLRGLYPSVYGESENGYLLSIDKRIYSVQLLYDCCVMVRLLLSISRSIWPLFASGRTPH